MFKIKAEKSEHYADILKKEHIKPNVKVAYSDEEILEQIQDHLYPNMTGSILCFVLENKFNASSDRLPILVQKIKEKYGENCLSEDHIKK